ncbi:DnaB-like helicase C-terminal domain-containing protein, partial [Staphylococcus epidermidis]|uniref:DnaB-like helicase C-terminal domain-containing protein n=1 Tax=Staphylococcus epidermidis TaxID=1282 RepID=UPI0037D9FBAE
NVHSNPLTTPTITQEHSTPFTIPLPNLSPTKIFIHHTPPIPINHLPSKSPPLKQHHPLHIILIHYLQFIQPTPSPFSHNPQQQLSHISPTLNPIPPQLQSPLIPLTHLSPRLQHPQHKPPIITDIPQSP